MSNISKSNVYLRCMKTKFCIAVATLATSLVFHSCEELDFLKGADELTETEIVQGLKQALTVGTDTAVSHLNKTDGYFGDAIVKILLPEEAQPVYDVINKLPGSLVDNAILAINRAAEDAAKEATPIFVEAILSMTIDDGLTILNGTDTAATTYLRINTEQKLYDAFKPKIEASLSKDLVLGYSAEELYSDLINVYNKASLGGSLYDEITTNSLSEHTTRRALRGLFIKVGDEEKLIRTDVSHRVTDLLEKVFAEQD